MSKFRQAKFIFQARLFRHTKGIIPLRTKQIQIQWEHVIGDPEADQLAVGTYRAPGIPSWLE